MAAKLQLKQVMEGQSILSHLISSFLGVSVGGANLPLNSESVQHVARYSGTLSLSLYLSLSLSPSPSLSPSLPLPLPLSAVYWRDMSVNREENSLPGRNK